MANVILDGVTYNGVNDVSLKDADNAGQRIKFVLPSPPLVEKDVNFYDYDGTLLYSYTAADFADLSALPANPTHTRLVAQGWNWSLSDAKTYVATYGKLNIGQVYTTASGKTEYDIEINEATGFTATLTGTNGTEKDWGDGTIDTLESHTYSTAGSYTIKLGGTYLPSVYASKKARRVYIANGVVMIQNRAIAGCRNLEEVTIPSSVTSMGVTFLAGDYKIKCIVLPINLSTFGSCETCYALEHIIFNRGITSIGSYYVSYCNCLKSVTIPDTVTEILENAFQFCYSLESVTIPNSVISMGQSCFASCAIKSIKVPSSISTFGSSVIGLQSGISSIVLENGLTSLGNNMFNNGKGGVLSVTIPSTVTSIGTRALYGLEWLTIVTVLATTPPTVASNSFPSNVTTIYIPHGTLATYQADTNWSTYASKLVELPA